ncbi:protein SanA, affects membrane permeability for vancomycin [Eubacterium ruminantium]|nr:protein SanA, affects membrane permeability for vancomycin [Eubacterium ruminantium]
MKTSEKSEKKPRSILKKTIKISIISVCVILFICIAGTIAVNIEIILREKKKIRSIEDIPKDYDCILVLGCSVREDGTPSSVLRERLDKAIELYNRYGGKILMSGDHKTLYYNEVRVMKEYAVSHGVPSEDIFLDHAGYSTYDSIYRAKYTYDIKKMVIVTTKYHLFRALYIADVFGIDAYGYASKDVKSEAVYNNIREIFARDKDFISCILKPQSEVTGDKISIFGNGDVTNIKDYDGE